ncbi:MAG: class I SAM-dependent methyltransferase [Treponema sp.]|nr:class I SAM-dependent methyltransferase [Treponema sp.]
MLKTNYKKVSKVYDKNKTRTAFAKDNDLEELLSQKEEITVLDLACGTGNWLLSQQTYFEDKKIKWIGLDASEDMLKLAEEKNINAQFIQSKVEDMSIKSKADLIVCNFAFHHFEDKKTALEKIFSTLNNKGILKYRNIEPEFMKDWWVYKYCPETYFEDFQRFWQKESLCYELSKAGFSNISVKREYYESYKNIDLLYENYKRRDASQLAMIGDKEYQKGLKRIELEIANGEKEYKDVISFLDIKCEKS